MVRKTRAHRTTTSSSTLVFESDRFRTEKNQETFKKQNIFRLVWVDRKVVLDKLDPKIRRNFECMVTFDGYRLVSSTRTFMSTPMIPTLSL